MNRHRFATADAQVLNRERLRAATMSAPMPNTPHHGSSHLVKFNNCLALTIILVGLAAQFADAAPILNGDFSSGLAGWTVSDAAFVSIVGDQVVMFEHGVESEVVLSQPFTLPTDSTALSFDLISLVTEADSGFLPDALNVSLLNPATLGSLVPTVDLFSDAYYTRDLVDGVSQGVAASGVTTTPSATSLPMTVILDVAGLSGQDALLQFKLIGGGVDLSSSLTLDNVQVVPEPTSWQLMIAAALIIGVRSAHRRRLFLAA